MKKGFTLAEVLITLAIIGVVAAITIPSVIVNTNQMEFKTGLRKAVSVLNQAITLNKALTGESPYDNSDLYNYLQQNMSVMKGSIIVGIYTNGNQTNYAFYTTDGMKFEVPVDNGLVNNSIYDFPLYESDNSIGFGKKGNCGSYGLTHNQYSTTETPCIVVADVNGDRKPSPMGSLINSGSEVYGSSGWVRYYYRNNADNHYNKIADPNGRLLTDIFSIMITDQGAIPYGVVAQKAMYQAQK